MLTPGLQLLRSPPETASTQAVSGEGSPGTRSHIGTYQEGKLFRWAEYHQHQFRSRLTEQNLGPYALSIIGGHQLQTSSMTQEYREFLRALGPVRDRAHLPGTSFFQKACSWFIIVGNCCSLLLVCWIVSQLWYNGTKIIQSLKQRAFHTCLGTILRAFCCGIATFITNPKYSPVLEAREYMERF